MIYFNSSTKFPVQESTMSPDPGLPNAWALWKSRSQPDLDVVDQHKTQRFGRLNRERQVPSLQKAVSKMIYLAALNDLFRS